MDKFRVIIFSNRMTVDCQDRLRGISRFLDTHPGWDPQFVVRNVELTSARVHEACHRGVDGFLVDISASDAVLNALMDVSTPIVTLDVREHALCDGRSNVRTVCCDDEGVAKEAVRHFLDQGRFHSFAFMRDGINTSWATIRQNTFIRILADKGIFCHLYEPSIEGSARRDLARWLRRLPKPAAVMTVHDFTAVRLLSLAEELKLKVPQMLAVLGADNDELLCTNAHPTLSSVSPDFEEEGFRGARLLDELMRTPKRVPASPIFVPVGRTHVRESSSPISQAGNLVRRALQYIDRNAHKGIDVEDVARALGISRRLLHLRFQEIQGTTPYDVIRTRRLDLVRHRLAMTHESIAEIAASCGFASENHLMHLFKREFGVTMRAFRRNAQT